MEAIIKALAQELGQKEVYVENVVRLIDEGATIPVIARYRKELHGSMDDQLLRQLADRLQYLRNLDQRRSEVSAAIQAQGKLTEELSAAIAAAATLAEVEDLYRPYKQKRRTRATIARERGLEPLTRRLSAKGSAQLDAEQEAAAFIASEKGVETIQDALQGASDILAEEISDQADLRKQLRELAQRRGVLVSKAAQAEPEDTVYRLYYDFRCPVSRLHGHQILAMDRGEREKVLKVSLELDPETAHVTVRRAVVPGAACMDFVRSAVSIARRLQDPLAELVKIDPKAIGVGQYQHDMPQARLSQALDGVVEDCVNAVGVDANTASPSLLVRVSGLTNTTAKNLVAYREENGAFTSRRQLLKVPKLGPKAFEQCAGFIRVPESAEPLDRTGVHPESYPAAKKLLQLCACKGEGDLSQLRERAEEIGLAALAEQCGVGLPTLNDMIRELSKPGRDPRDELPPPILRTDVMEAKDLKPGMELQGTVRNVVDFGVFVDIGVHQDGLVHVTQLPWRVKHPSDRLAVGDVVTVWVLSVDEGKKRISLTMKKPS